jgi:hypothetical protein
MHRAIFILVASSNKRKEEPRQHGDELINGIGKKMAAVDRLG